MGGTFGAVVGWSAGRARKGPVPVEVAHFDALAAARAAVWREAPRHHGPDGAAPPLQLSAPLLAFRF